MCIRNVFLLVESQVLLAMLLQRADLQRLPGPEAQPNAQMTMPPIEDVNLRLTWRE